MPWLTGRKEHCPSYKIKPSGTDTILSKYHSELISFRAETILNRDCSEQSLYSIAAPDKGDETCLLHKEVQRRYPPRSLP
jgi:hypothetical protein